MRADARTQPGESIQPCGNSCRCERFAILVNATRYPWRHRICVYQIAHRLSGQGPAEWQDTQSRPGRRSHVLIFINESALRRLLLASWRFCVTPVPFVLKTALCGGNSCDEERRRNWESVSDP